MLTEEATINQLKFAIQALSLEAEGQLAAFPEFVMVTDELLLEFDNWKNAAVANYPNYSQGQSNSWGDLQKSTLELTYRRNRLPSLFNHL